MGPPRLLRVKETQRSQPITAQLSHSVSASRLHVIFPMAPRRPLRVKETQRSQPITAQCSTMAQNGISNIQGQLDPFHRQITKRKRKSDFSSTSTQNQEGPSEPEGPPQKRREREQDDIKPSTTASCLDESTHRREARDRGFQKDQCNLCADVADISSWDCLDPKMSTGEEDSVTFHLSSASGQYQCTRSGMRWVCAGEVSLQYRYASWGRFREELAKKHYQPAGPLMDIEVRSGKLEEIHLPHFVCVGGSEQIAKDTMSILHGQDGKVSFESCEVSRFHVKFVNPSFCPVGPVTTDEPGKPVHSKLLHYRPSATSLIQRTYLIPDDRHLENMVRHQEGKCNSIEILLPDPEERLKLGDKYSLSTIPTSIVTPREMILRCSEATPTFYKVVMRKVRFKFNMKLTHIQDNECVWEGSIHKDDFCQTTAKTNTKTLLEAARFVDQHRLELLRIKFVIPIAEEMLSKGLINLIKLSDIRAASTSEEKMRCVYDCLGTVGLKGKAMFYEILQKYEPLLVDSLNDPTN